VITEALVIDTKSFTSCCCPECCAASAIAAQHLVAGRVLCNWHHEASLPIIMRHRRPAGLPAVLNGRATAAAWVVTEAAFDTLLFHLCDLIPSSFPLLPSIVVNFTATATPASVHWRRRQSNSSSSAVFTVVSSSPALVATFNAFSRSCCCHILLTSFQTAV